jgi:hypothetical protein
MLSLRSTTTSSPSSRFRASGFSDGTSIVRGWRCPTGAGIADRKSLGKDDPTVTLAEGVCGFATPTVCAKETRLLSSAVNKIVPIQVFMAGVFMAGWTSLIRYVLPVGERSDAFAHANYQSTLEFRLTALSDRNRPPG